MKDLKTLKHLEVLDSGGTAITDAALKDLASITTLKSLELGRTRVTAKGVKTRSRMKNLTFLDLWHSSITEEELADLKKVMPNCEFSHSYSPNGK